MISRFYCVDTLVARQVDTGFGRTYRGVVPGWFFKVTNEVNKGLSNIAIYVDDVIVFLSRSRCSLVPNIEKLFTQL